jgi:acetyl-CoA acyltransferase
MAKYAYIVDAVRSPMGVKKGELIGIRPDELSAQTVKALLKRNPDFPVEAVEDVVLGNAFPEASQGMLMARGVALLAGIPQEAGAKVVNRFCGSSMDAAHQISQAIEVGDMEAGIAIGIEDMFGVPMGGYNPSFHPELAKMNYYIGMGETAENLAKDLDINRDDQEAFSVASHKKALKAMAEGKFDNEIVAIEYNGKKLTKDEGPKEPNLEKIKSLKPVFDSKGTVTAATSSPLSIGAAALLIVSEEAVKKYNLKPRAKIVARSIAGVDWTKMGMGPLYSTEKLMKKHGYSWDDIDVVELNEAFAAQSLWVIRKGNWPTEKINLHGGAIALGHPLGASGARIMVTLLNVMEQNDYKRGLATMCIGSGQGISTVIERV